MKTFTLFSPTRPVKGMVSARSVFTLRPDEYALLQNVRVDDGVIKCRDGLGDLSATSLPSGWIVGAAQLALNGTDYVFIAVDTGSSIRVLASTGVAFTEWTGTGASPWNETRFDTTVTPNANKRVAFVSVKAPSRADSGILSTTADEDMVVASDGVKTIVSAVSDARFRPMVAVSVPTALATFRQEATFPDFMPCSSGLSGKAESDVSDVVASTSATYTPTGGAAPQISFTTAVETDGTDYGELQWTTANNICQGPVVALMYGTNEPNIWDRVKLEFYDASAAALKVVWNPDSTTTTKDKPTVVTIDASKGVYMAVFALDEANTPAADNYSRLRLTYMYDAAPSVQMDFFLLGWYAGGLVPGGTLFQITSYGSLTYTECEPVTCQDRGGVENTQLGMTDKRNKFEVPVTGACSYAYRLTYTCSSQANDGIDYTLIYAQFPNENGFQPYAFQLIAQDNFGVAGTGYNAGYSAGGLIAVTVNSATLLQRKAPKPFHRSMYPFKTAFWADGRLFLGGVKKGITATLFGGFFFSAKGNPFDFSEFERFHSESGELDLSGPGTVPLGSETPQAITSLGSRSEQEVTTPLMIVTDKATWGVNTKDASTILRPTFIAPYGTKAPDSVCVGNGALYFFDIYRQVRRVFQRVDSPGQWVVDNLWNGIPTTTARTGSNRQTNPRVERVACAYFKDKLYVFYTPTGQSYNVACSVYDTVHDLWYDDTLASGNIEKPFVWPVAGDEPQLRGFSVGDDVTTFDSAPKLYQHEKSGQSTDDGSAIVTNVQTGMMSHPDSDEPMTEWALLEVGVVCDEVTGGSFTVTRSVLPSGDSISNTSIDLDDDNSGAYIVRWDRDSDGNRGQLASGFAHQFSLSSSTFTPGKRIMAIYFKWDPRGGGTDVNG